MRILSSYNFILKIIVLIFLFNNSAYAYIDPGIGSIVLQAIVGVLAVVVTFFSFSWQKVKNFIKKKFSSKKKKFDSDSKK